MQGVGRKRDAVRMAQARDRAAVRLHRTLSDVTRSGLIRLNWARAFFAAIACASLAGCYAEGQSFFLTHGEPERFWFMEACVAEATAEHKDGTPKYSGYVCVHKLLFVELAKQEFYEGEAQLSTSAGQTDEGTPLDP